ncbi:AraC-like DNA-binding protein [Homoserinimonas aerilata]|uniref:AraC-like DNA-binding protein n=1 Tax=Homoserinimonas aerilata TaxID=1162970 RepID=A0A542YHH2_9MICO|nr:helix-turn-helix domain-containing protein [Homoserinimonas aerilata]TQL47461.1 AraC-like DNA-binding protein [Homoserinimonas aerilata]
MEKSVEMRGAEHEMLLYGWLETESLGEDRPQHTSDAVVVRTDGANPRVTRHFRIGTLDVAHISGDRVDVEPLLTARRWKGVVLGFVTAGHLSVSQGEQTVQLGVGDFVFYTPAQRYRITSPGYHEYLVVRIPIASIALRYSAFSDVVATDLSRLPSAAVLRGILAGLSRPDSVPSLAASVHVGDAVLAAAHAVIADARPAGSAESISLFTTFVLWIEDNLADPDLSADRIAAVHFLSTRYVRRIFAANGTTITAMVRQRRLERVRDELLDPRMARHSISSVAERWGLADPASFSRAFRRQFGSSPRQYRALHLHQGQPGATDEEAAS